MKYLIAISAFVIVAVAAHGRHKIYPNCPPSESFNNTKKECREKVFGADATPPPPSEDGSHHHGPMDPAKRDEFKKCMAEKLGFDMFGTLTVDDVDKIMAATTIASDELRETMKAAATACITDHKGVGKEVFGCFKEALEKNCS